MLANSNEVTAIQEERNKILQAINGAVVITGAGEVSREKINENTLKQFLNAHKKDNSLATAVLAKINAYNHSKEREF